MMKSRSFRQFALLAGALTGTSAGLGRACDCQVAPPPKEARTRADAVFQGRVSEISAVDASGRIKVTFLVSRHWKGKFEKKRAVVRTSAGGGSCGYPFKAGEDYLVYTFLQEGQPATSICTRTTPIADARFDLSELGPADNQP